MWKPAIVRLRCHFGIFLASALCVSVPIMPASSGGVCFGKEFGAKIQETVKQKDLEALFSLVEGELVWGPRRAYIKGKSFDDIFPEEWRKRVLSGEPECSGHYIRGYNLGHGAIWYSELLQGGSLQSINGNYLEIPWEKRKQPWTHGDQALTGACFAVVGITADTYEAMHERFASEVEYSEFEEHIGKFLGGKVPLKPIHRNYGTESNPVFSNISMVRNVTACIEAKEILYEYQVLRNIDKKYCKMLLPNLPRNCIDIKLLKVLPLNCHGSACPVFNVIYSTVEHPENGNLYVVPLVNLGGNENEALNYVDKHLQ